MGLIYQLGIRIYAMLLRLASTSNKKARQWVVGRKGLTKQLQSLPELHNTWWFHCASLGEFEQARPLIEAIKNQHPDHSVLITFFSPSGYEVRKNYDLADHVMYLPIDTKANARKFIKVIAPSKAIFIKYEFWFNMLGELKANGIPTYLAAGVFHRKQTFFKSYGGWAKRQLASFSHFFLQDIESAKLLEELGYNNYTVAGDTRYDRVNASVKNAQPVPEVEAFLRGSECWIAGSTWPADEDILLEFYNNYQGDKKLIIAPHEIDKSHIKRILDHANQPSVLFSDLLAGRSSENANILIVDTIGHLSNIYQYGQIAYIGGAFHGALHNILEAVTFGLPVVFGPDYHKFPEAKALIDRGGASSIATAGQLESVMLETNVAETSSINKAFIKEHLGATSTILSAIT